MDKDLVKALAMATSAGLTLVFCIGGLFGLDIHWMVGLELNRYV